MKFKCSTPAAVLVPKGAQSTEGEAVEGTTNDSLPPSLSYRGGSIVIVSSVAGYLPLPVSQPHPFPTCSVCLSLGLE